MRKRSRRRRPVYRIRRAIRRLDRLMTVALTWRDVTDRLIAKSEHVESLIKQYYPDRSFDDVYEDIVARKL